VNVCNKQPLKLKIKVTSSQKNAVIVVQKSNVTHLQS